MIDDDIDDDRIDNRCTWCDGLGVSECDDPIQCCSSDCNGVFCMCKACDGRGFDQEVW